jgi:hypothetical protein
MEIHHLDIKCTFLHEHLKEDICMRLPDQFAPANSTVFKLKKSLYGLRQAPRAWNDLLTKDLKVLGYTPFEYTESIYRRCKKGVIVYFLVYVDDILLISSSNDSKDIKSVKDEISGFYKIKDLGKASFFLGIKLDYHDNDVNLSQVRNIESLLERFNFTES